MSQQKSPRVVIVGAGLGGLMFAIKLQRRFGKLDFTIFEKTEAVGGTWHENRYPGCSSDIPIPFYSLSTDQSPDWTSSHPLQPEIQAYWEGLSRKYSLTPHIRFGTRVVKAVWDSTRSLYQVTFEDVKTGSQSTTCAEIFVSALGILEVPKFPDISGLSSFKGQMFHSAQWIDTNLDGKRLAIIGNGSSACQFMPILARNPNIRITQFCRTANWILPPVRMNYSKLHIFACRYIPLYMRLVRFLNYCASDLGYILIFSNRVTRRWVQMLFRQYIIVASPEEFRELLIPKYELGCRRIVFDQGYLAALHCDNVRITYDGIDSIVEDGIVTKEGKHLPFDTIILATGYHADKYPLHIEGKDGQTIQEYFDSKDGPTAYMGTTIPGFPNLYIIGGPNTATGHTSVAFTEEVQVNYSLDLIKPILEGKLRSINVKHTAADRHNKDLQTRLSGSVFSGCNSWYRVNGTAKINTMFPGSAAQFWWCLWRPVWKDYEVVGVDGETLTGGSSEFVKISILGVVMGVAVAVVPWVWV